MGGVEISKKPNFIITIRYEIPTFSSVGPFFKEGGRGSRKFRQEAEIFEIFSIEVAPKVFVNFSFALSTVIQRTIQQFAGLKIFLMKKW